MVKLWKLELGLSSILFVSFFALIGSIGTVLAMSTVAERDVISCSVNPAKIGTQPTGKRLDDLTDKAIRQTKNTSLGDSAKRDNLEKLYEIRKANLAQLASLDPDAANEQLLTNQNIKDIEQVSNNCVETKVSKTGYLRSYVNDIRDGENNRIDEEESETVYELVSEDGKQTDRIYIANESQLNSKSVREVEISGHTIDDGTILIDAADEGAVKAVADDVSDASALYPETSGTQRTIVLPAYFQDTPIPSTLQSSLDSLVFTDVNGAYQESSYGQLSLSGETKPWTQIAKNRDCSSSSTLTRTIEAFDSSVDFRNFDRLIIPSDYEGICSWAGRGSIGKWLVSTNDGYVEMSISWVDIDWQPLLVTTHELGHNFGLNHANFLDCGNETITNGNTGCSEDAYADTTSPMGNRTYPVAHFNAHEKQELGWANSNRVVNVTSSGDYTLNAFETITDDLKQLRISRSNGSNGEFKHTYVEYRTPTGYDSSLPDNNLYAGGILHVSNGDEYATSGESDYSYLLDATPPGNEYSPALLPGSTFTDPATKTTINVLSKTATQLNLRVTLGKTNFSTISISSSLSSSQNPAPENLTFSASPSSSGSSIKQVDFYLDSTSNTPVATDTTAPYQYNLDTTTIPDGQHTLYARAQDATGDPYGAPNNYSSFSSKTFTVSNDNIAPTVSLTAPTNGSTINGTVSLSATAADNRGVERVEFRYGGTTISTDTSSPYSASWNTTSISDGSYTLYARAYDAAGNYSDSSVAITINNTTSTDTLSSNQTLTSNDQLASVNSAYTLRMQPDGNLVLYSSSGVAAWNTETSGSSGAYLAMQPDGNLVLYSATRRPLWQTGTFGNANSRLVVQPDGNLVIYTGSGKAIWSRATGRLNSTTDTLRSNQTLVPGNELIAVNNSHRLRMQSDGNLVIYNDSGGAVWNARTSGNPGAYLAMQPDGNLVIYSADRRPLWRTNTLGNSNTKLVMQADGNLVIYNGSGKPIWSRFSGII